VPGGKLEVVKMKERAEGAGNNSLAMIGAISMLYFVRLLSLGAPNGLGWMLMIL